MPTFKSHLGKGNLPKKGKYGPTMGEGRLPGQRGWGNGIRGMQ